MFDTLRRWSMAIVILGVVLLVYGIAAYLPGFDEMLWAAGASGMFISIIGIVLMIVGALNMKLQELLLEEVSLVKYELNKLRQSENG
ncbi:hypothetical protein D3P09_18545 [Paenibacillus pinisoli]|uniref:Uncharacterized protein n=1 Tax=Paenibacillus pinisoli TaxID=1276110 RepID=A0A3A6PNI3_9BACL|nr:hypothetical protein [Paenibacillus pinisoli]RJX38071.1 hypothetical protein D3P09_18545 [Paenibacillus pinisoli]